MKTFALAIVLILLPVFCYPQTDSLRESTAELIQSILDDDLSGEADEGLINLVEELKENPVDLNAADITALQKIPGIGFADAKAIVDYRKRRGRFFSVKELILAGIPENVVNFISPFLLVNFPGEGSPSSGTPGIRIKMRNRLVKDLQREAGFAEHKFSGNSLHTYSRLKASFGGSIRAGLLVDKDPGEKSYNDMTSGYFSTGWPGIADKIILGDFSVEFGQGLAIWSPYSFSKGSDAIYPVKKNARILNEYGSSDENRFMRGAAIELSAGMFTAAAFYSSNKFDASLDPGNNKIISTPLSGLHRTGTEKSKKHGAYERIIGSVIGLNSADRFNINFLYYHSAFSNSFQPGNIYDISGNEFNFYSISYDVYFDILNFSGETSFDGKSAASIINLQISPGRNIALITSVRNYPRNYFNLHSRGFGETANTRNEIGIYNGIKWRTAAGTFNFYYDQFRFPFSTSTSPVPTSGNELSFDFLSARLNDFNIHLKYKREVKEAGFDNNGGIGVFKRIKTAARFEVIYYPDKKLRLKSRIELNSYKVEGLNETGSGLLIFQDARLRTGSSFNFAARVIFFSTDSFKNVVYEFENDLDGMFPLYGLYGEGIRWYLLTGVNLLGALELTLKYSETYKPRENYLGSGYSKITGNLENRISIQLDISL